MIEGGMHVAFNRRLNKNTHILTIINRSNSNNINLKLKLSESILIDDDKKNVDRIQNPMHAIHLDPSSPNQFLVSFLLI